MITHNEGVGKMGCRIKRWILKRYSLKQEKFDVVIGEYDKEINQRNQSFIIGEGHRKDKQE